MTLVCHECLDSLIIVMCVCNLISVVQVTWTKTMNSTQCSASKDPLKKGWDQQKWYHILGAIHNSSIIYHST